MQREGMALLVFSSGASLLFATASPVAADVEVRLEWSRTWNGASNHSDECRKVAAALDGGAYVAGSRYILSEARHEFTIIRYDANGAILWTRPMPGYAWVSGPASLVLDPNGDPVVARLTREAGGPQRMGVAKLAAAHGAVVWENLLDPGGTCYVNAHDFEPLAVGPGGEVTVTLCNMRTIQFDPDGVERWARDERPSAAVDVGTSVMVGADGRVYVVGRDTDGPAGYAIVAYDPNGTHLWSDLRPSDHGGLVFDPAFVRVGPSGEVFMLCGPETTCGLFSTVLFKYQPNGVLEWRRIQNTNPCASQQPIAMQIDDAGNAIALTFPSFKPAVLKYGPSGDLLWSRLHQGSGSVLPEALAVDAAGNSYAISRAPAPGDNADFFIESYAPDGATRWTQRHSQFPGHSDFPASIAVDPRGRVYAAGYTSTPSTGSDFELVRFTQRAPGDLNCDGQVNFGDIDPFVLALTSVSSYEASFPTCESANADLNNDREINFSDIDPFVAQLAG